MTSVSETSGATHKAHDIKRKRTQDVRIEESVDFTGLCLSSNVLSGLKSAGFVRPSPIQLKAIPLGRCGLDLIVQAKSGTGKTCVFTVIALENLILKSKGQQVLILAPTREIAMQIGEVIKSIGSHMAGLSCQVFIGGLPVAEDKQKLQKCQIAVGTPGRIKQLIEENVMSVGSIRLFILDEADKLLEDNFQDQINWIFSSLPDNKQILALSATYPEYLAQHLQAYMRNPTFVRLNVSDPALFGIRQYYEEVKFHPLPQVLFDEKVKHLTKLLSSVAFQQCLVFSNYQMRAQSLADVLINKGWPAAYISGSQDQHDRILAMDKLKKMHCRILISTDLTSRGIDVEHVNLVVNLDLPWDHETYLHRIGRAGRFGSYGAAVSFTAAGKEYGNLMAIADKCNTTIKKLPDPAPEDLARSSGYTDLESLVTVERVVTEAGCDATSQKAGSSKSLNDGDINGEQEVIGDAVANVKTADLELYLQDEIARYLQDEIAIDSTDLTPNAFIKDLENYSIRQEIGPEENEKPDWTDALQDVYSLVKEIKDLYVTEKSHVKDARQKECIRSEPLLFENVVEDYDKYIAECKDTEFINWLEDFNPGKNGGPPLHLTEGEIQHLMTDISEQSKRLLVVNDSNSDADEAEYAELDDDINDCIAKKLPSPVKSIDDSVENASDQDISHDDEGTYDDQIHKTKGINHKLYNNKVRMGIGSMLQHLRRGDDASAVNNTKPERQDDDKQDRNSVTVNEQKNAPLVYEDNIHDIALPEVVDFSEYDQSYLYFEQLGDEPGLPSGYDYNYEANDDTRYHENHAQLDEGNEYGEEMAEGETSDTSGKNQKGETSDTSGKNQKGETSDTSGKNQKGTVFKWVQENQEDGDGEGTDGSHRRTVHKGKKKKRQHSHRSQTDSRRQSQQYGVDDEQFSERRSESETSSKGRSGRYSNRESLHVHPGSTFPSTTEQSQFYPWYQYPAYPTFPYFSSFCASFSPAQYYAAAADMHAQWAKYYQKLSKASKNNDELSRVYKMQKAYIKSMSSQFR